MISIELILLIPARTAQMASKVQSFFVVTVVECCESSFYKERIVGIFSTLALAKDAARAALRETSTFPEAGFETLADAVKHPACRFTSHGNEYTFTFDEDEILVKIEEKKVNDGPEDNAPKGEVSIDEAVELCERRVKGAASKGKGRKAARRDS